MTSFHQLLRSTAQVAVRAYPFCSGGFRIANSTPMRWLVGSGEVETRLSCGARLRVRLDDMDGRTAYLLGDQDRKITSLFKAILRPGDTVLDIGANWGIMTLQMATLVGKTGAVHAFEPQPELSKAIEHSVSLNGFDQVRVHPIGLSTEARDAELTMLPSFSGIASLHGLPHWASNEKAITVRVRLVQASDYLDGLKINRLRMIKMDVEGHESEVLKGAARFLDRVRPDAILFERNLFARANHAASRSFWEDESVRWLSERGYAFAAIAPRTLLRLHVHELRPGDPTREAENFVALSPGPERPVLQRLLFQGLA